MNLIFKSKWCAATQSYVACSELTKRAGKVASYGAIFLAISSTVNAADLPTTISATGDVVGKAYTGKLDGGFFNINNNAIATIKGDMRFDITSSGDNETHLDVTNGSIITDDKLSVTIKPDTDVKFSRPKGLIIRGDSNSQIKNLDVDVTLASEQDTDRGTPDSNAAYGVALGYNYSGGAQDKYSRLVVDNANINVTNTANTVHGNKTVVRKIGFSLYQQK